MQPILNYLASLIDKYIVHVPPDQQQTFKDDFAVLAEGLAQSAAKGAAEGLTSKGTPGA